jgi:hypothetical protein
MIPLATGPGKDKYPSQTRVTRVLLPESSPSSLKDFQHPLRATEDTTARGSAPHQLSWPQLEDARAPRGHHSEDEQHTLESSPAQGSGYTHTKLREGPSLKDKYQNRYYRTRDVLKQTRDELKEARAMLGNYDHKLRRRNGDLRQANQVIESLHHDNQRLTDTNRSLQNELINVHHQFEDARTLSEVRGKELVGSQVFLTKADTLSISEIGEKVTALNEEIFQAAAALADALVHNRHEVPQADWEAAAAVTQEMVGEKMTKLLIDQSQKPEPEVNPLLVQVVLQIFMVDFCVSKIQSWYPGDSDIGDFLSAIYSQIRSTGKASHLISKNQILILTFQNNLF